MNDTGRIPPQAPDLEEAVLGAVLLERGAYEQIADILKVDVFYKPAHQKIYKAITDLYNQNEPIDILTLTQKLINVGEIESVGGPYYVSQLTNRVATAFNIEAHTRILLQKYMQRELIKSCTTAIQNAYGGEVDAFDLITSHESELNRIIEDRTRKDVTTIDRAITAVVSDLQYKVEQRKKGIEIHLRSGFDAIDRATGGLHPGDLTIIAARPGMGKTAFALSLLRNVAVDFKRPAAFFTLEVTNSQISQRLLSIESEIELSRIRDARLTDEDFQKISTLNDLINSRIFIDDTSALSIRELRAKCRRLRSKHKIELVIVDYLQLMTGDRDKNSNREQEISGISRSLKALAKELEIPVIALSQLSRALENRADKRPMLSDLRESGAIEQDSDNVAFLFRPEYYGIGTDVEGNSTEGLVEYNIAKHRHGETGKIYLQFLPTYTKFTNENNFKYETESTQPF